MCRAWLRWATLLTYLLSTCLADDRPFLQDDNYNQGDYGPYPRHKFHTTTIEPPHMNFMQPFTNCDDGSYLFVSPRGGVAESSFYILDHEGTLIWGPDHRYGEVYNFQAQQYKGESYLTLWAGDDSVGGHGEGEYIMFDQHYNEYKRIAGGNGVRADLHSFTITEEGTCVFTAYQVVQADLTSVGLEVDSWLWESLFQEQDIETGEVLFEWRASHHFPMTEVYHTPNKGTHKDPWDFFHINQVEKDASGNYLVSTRYGRCALYISRKTGEILWQLGGLNNSFKDLSGGDATIFLGQHDVHWRNGHDSITMFDNRADWFNRIEEESVGRSIHVDLVDMTAELMQSFRNPSHILSVSQGSVQPLPNGNVLVGYGNNGALTEYSPDGTPLCDAYMQPSKRFGSGDVQSYANRKFNWTGVPLTTPSLLYEGEYLYISWLGSTKVRSWLLQDCRTADGLFESVEAITKKGFETEYVLKLGKRMRQYVRVIAVDQGGTQLSTSAPVDLEDTIAIWGQPDPNEEDPHAQIIADVDTYQYNKDVEDVKVLLILGVLVVVSAALVAWMIFGKGCIPCGRLHTEKSGYRDDGSLRRRWDHVRALVPLPTSSWRTSSSSAGQGLLRGDDDVREAGGRRPSSLDFVIEDEHGRSA